MRSPRELVGISSRLKNFNKINRLMHSTKAAISCDCCSVLKLDFNIRNLIILFVEATVDPLNLASTKDIGRAPNTERKKDLWILRSEGIAHMVEANGGVRGGPIIA